MTWNTLSYHRDGPIGRVWLNRPERRNALNQQLLEELAEVFGQLARAFDVRVVILGGRGPSFCAGADLKDPPGVAQMGDPNLTIRERLWISDLGTRAIEAIERADAITIARVQGHAIGGGALLALACDLRIAAEGTLFGIPEVGLGDVLGWKGIPRLIADVGIARARELVLLGHRIDALTAERYGLVNRVVAADALDQAVEDWARRISSQPETALSLTKGQFRSYAALESQGSSREIEAVLELEAMRDEATRARFSSGPPVHPSPGPKGP
ncbi:MAG: enoyl-CoA hydratase/isomerase family protein [Gemmatimonadales bacterium]